MIAMHVGYRIYSRLEPVLSICAIMAKTPWVLEKASPARVNELNELEEKVISGADAFVSYAVEVGDVKFSPAVGSDVIVFANWSIAFGSNKEMGFFLGVFNVVPTFEIKAKCQHNGLESDNRTIDESVPY